MPKPCSVCTDPRSGEINKALITGAGTINGLAERFKIVHTTLKRHRSNCLRLPSVREPKAQPGEKLGASCEQGIVPEPARNGQFASLDPQALIAGTARLVDEALDLLEHAKKADDRRLALSALKEARDGLALLMKAAGMLVGESGTNLTIDARKQTVQLVAGLGEEELRAIVALGQRAREGSRIQERSINDTVPTKAALPKPVRIDDSSCRS